MSRQEIGSRHAFALESLEGRRLMTVVVGCATPADMPTYTAMPQGEEVVAVEYQRPATSRGEAQSAGKRNPAKDARDGGGEFSTSHALPAAAHRAQAMNATHPWSA